MKQEQAKTLAALVLLAALFVFGLPPACHYYARYVEHWSPTQPEWDRK